MTNEYTVTATDAGYAVIDSMDVIVECCATKIAAAQLARDMNKLAQEHSSVVAEADEADTSEAEAVVENVITEAEASIKLPEFDALFFAAYGAMFYGFTCCDDTADTNEAEVIDTTAPVDVIEVAATKAETKNKFRADFNGTKAEQVRARVVQAKEAGESQMVVEEWVVRTLGMKRQLARVYTKENWPRV